MHLIERYVDAHGNLQPVQPVKMKKALSSLAILIVAGTFVFAPFASASIGPIATTGDISQLAQTLSSIQDQVTKLQQEVNGQFGVVYNPTPITSSSIIANLPQPLGTTSTPTFGGQTINGTSTANGYNALVSSTVSSLINFQGTLNVPYNYSSSTYGDFGTYINTWTTNQAAAGFHAVEVNIPVTGIPSGNWAVGINVSSSNMIVLFNCQGESPVVWTGASTSTILNTGTANKTFFSGWTNCYVEGSGRVGQTFIQFGGSNGAFQGTLSNDLIRNWYRGVVPAANDPFIQITNSSFQFVTQPLDLNFNGINNAGENTYVGHTVFGGCEANGLMATSTNSPIYMVNNAGTVFDSDSFDDCPADLGGGDTVTVIGGWDENPGSNATPYNGTPWWTNETSTTNILTMINPNFYNDVGSSVTGTGNGAPTIPPEWILNDATLNIQGGWASSLTSASSVAKLVADGSAATLNISGFLNASNGTQNGVTQVIDAANSNITFTAGSGFFNCQVAANSYAWCQKQTGNVYQQYYANGVYTETIVPAAAGNTSLETEIGNTRAPTSTFEIEGTYACDVNTPGSGIVIPTNSGGNNYCGYDYIGATATTTFLPSIAQTQNRLYNFKATGAGNLLLNASSSDLFKIGFVTSTAYTVTAGGYAQFQNDGTYWELMAASPQKYLTPTISGAIVGLGCDTATSSVDAWVSTSTTSVFSNLPTTPAINTQGVTWSSYLSAPGIVTTQACSDVTVTPTASKATFSVQ